MIYEKFLSFQVKVVNNLFDSLRKYKDLYSLIIKEEDKVNKNRKKWFKESFIC